MLTIMPGDWSLYGNNSPAQPRGEAEHIGVRRTAQQIGVIDTPPLEHIFFLYSAHNTNPAHRSTKPRNRITSFIPRQPSRNYTAKIASKRSQPREEHTELKIEKMKCDLMRRAQRDQTFVKMAELERNKYNAGMKSIGSKSEIILRNCHQHYIGHAFRFSFQTTGPLGQESP